MKDNAPPVLSHVNFKGTAYSMLSDVTAEERASWDSLHESLDVITNNGTKPADGPGLDLLSKLFQLKISILQRILGLGMNILKGLPAGDVGRLCYLVLMDHYDRQKSRRAD